MLIRSTQILTAVENHNVILILRRSHLILIRSDCKGYSIRSRLHLASRLTSSHLILSCAPVHARYTTELDAAEAKLRLARRRRKAALKSRSEYLGWPNQGRALIENTLFYEIVQRTLFILN